MTDQRHRAYRGRVLSSPMDVEHLVHLLERIEAAQIRAWLDGGWGVDALLEEQTREHDDLDLVIELGDAGRLIDVLESEGYERVLGAPPKSFVLVDGIGHQVDVHPVEFDEAGNGIYLMESGETWVYPAEGFSGKGSVGNYRVDCLSPSTQVLVHDGYELGAKDFRELRQLHERFGVPLPEHVRDRALFGDHRRSPHLNVVVAEHLRGLDKT